MKETGGVHLIFVVLLVAILLNFASSVFELIHLSKYADDGIGSNFCDLMAAVSEAICDFIVTFLLLSVSSGWTLTSSMPMDLSSLGYLSKKSEPNASFYWLNSHLRKPFKLMSQFNFASIVLAFLFLFHIILIIWGRSYNDEFDTFHDFEHIPGKVLMLFRLACGICFWFSASNIITLQYNVGEMASFLLKFRLLGLLWFLSLPIVVLLAPLWAEYLRHWWIAGATMLFQTLALGFFSLVLIKPIDSVYYRKSTAGAQFLALGSSNIKDFTGTRSMEHDGFIQVINEKKNDSMMQGLNNTIKAVKKARIHVD